MPNGFLASECTSNSIVFPVVFFWDQWVHYATSSILSYTLKKVSEGCRTLVMLGILTHCLLDKGSPWGHPSKKTVSLLRCKDSTLLCGRLIQELRNSFKFENYVLMTRVFKDPTMDVEDNKHGKVKKIKVNPFSTLVHSCWKYFPGFIIIINHRILSMGYLP